MNRSLLFVPLVFCGAFLVFVSDSFSCLAFGIMLEVMALFGMAVCAGSGVKTLEASFKYLVASAFGCGLIIFGLAVFSGYIGVESLPDLADYLGSHVIGFGAGSSTHSGTWAGGALVFIVTGFAVLLGLVPTHSWQVDFFESQPTFFSAILDSVVKVSLVSVLVRLFAVGVSEPQALGLSALTFFGVLSVLGGGILALTQNNLKKLFSNISSVYFGMIFLGVASLGGMQDFGTDAVVVLAASYAGLSVAVLCALSLFERNGLTNLGIHDLVGLGSKYPLPCSIFGFACAFLAGFPFFNMGYMAKTYLLEGFLRNSEWFLAVVVCLGGLFVLYPMIKLIAAMFLQHGSRFKSTVSVHPQMKVLPSLVAITLVGLSLYFSTMGTSTVLKLSKKYTIGLIKK